MLCERMGGQGRSPQIAFVVDAGQCQDCHDEYRRGSCDQSNSSHESCRGFHVVPPMGAPDQLWSAGADVFVGAGSDQNQIMGFLSNICLSVSMP